MTTETPPQAPTCINPARLLPPDPDDRIDRDPYRLVPSVKAEGVTQALLVHPEPELKAYRVLDGETRRQAALIAGCTSVPIRLVAKPASATERRKLVFRCNEMGKSMTPQEVAAMLLADMEDHCWTQKQVADAYGISQSDVSKKLAALKSLAPELRDKKLPQGVCYQIARLPVGDQGAVAERWIAGQFADRSNLTDEVNRLLDGGKVKADKPVTLKTPRGVSLTYTGLDYDALLAELGVIAEAVRRAKKENFPQTILPGLLKAPGTN